MFLPLRTILISTKYFLLQLQGYNFKIFKVGRNEHIYIIEDSLLLYIKISKQFIPFTGTVSDDFTKKIMKNYNRKFHHNKYINKISFETAFYRLEIEELTPNLLDFNTKHTKFIHQLETIFDIPDLMNDIKYKTFKGFYFNINKKDYSQRLPYILSKKYPQLKIKERYSQWDGFKYFFIIMRVRAKDGSIAYSIALKRKILPHNYITQRAKSWIQKGFNYNIDFFYSQNFIYALLSWKGIKRQFILENYFAYAVIEKSFKEEYQAKEYIRDIYIQNIFEKNLDWQQYNRPTYRWVSEEKLLKLTKNLYKNQKIIYQHKPYFLVSDKGHQLSYDIFIPHLKIAIEYQGKQHFEPVDYFGGEDAFIRTQERDRMKQKLSKANGIILIYYNYWEDINIDTLKSKIKAVLFQKH